MSQQRATVLGWGELRTIYTAWSQEYLVQPAHLRINGRPVCAFLNLADFVSSYGLASFQALLVAARAVIRRTTGLDPLIIGLFHEANRRNVWLANRLEIDAASGYGLLPTWSGPPVQDYATLMRQRIREWYVMQRDMRVPFLPVVCCGWDASMRGEQVPDLLSATGFPWRPIVTRPTPELFGEFLDAAITFNQNTHRDFNVVFLHAWNEWTEQSALEPSDHFGHELLDQVAMRS